MDEFTVSVIIPVYNAAPFLQCAVDSALLQPQVKEVVLVDDGSTDGSYAVAQRLQESHPDRVKLFAHPGRANRGPGATRNLGLEKACCPFVAFLDADDWYLPGYFQFDREAFDRDPNLGMVRHPLGNGWNPDDPEQQWFIDYTGKTKAHARFHTRVDNLDSQDYFNQLYPMGQISSGIADTLTIRRSLIDKIGRFPERDWAEDTTFHLKLAAVGTVAFANMDQPLAIRRIHADNLSRHKAGKLDDRIDSTGQALLDLMDFAKKQKLSAPKKAALHRGWLRFGQRYTRHPSYAMLRKWPWALLNPQLAWSYARLYKNILSRMLRP